MNDSWIQAYTEMCKRKIVYVVVDDCGKTWRFASMEAAIEQFPSAFQDEDEE